MTNRITPPPRIQKQPYEEFDISCDFSSDLGSGETIDAEASAVAAYTQRGDEVTETIIKTGTLAVSGAVISVDVQGGTVADGKYKISFRAVTNQGRKFERDIMLVMFD